jgi:predicted Zn-dependent protease
LEVIKTAPKPRPDIPDAQWEGAKKDFQAQGMEALGMVAVLRKKPDEAIGQFKAAIDMAATPEPATKVRLASVYNETGKYDEAIALLDGVLAEQNLNPAIRQIAGAEKLKAATGKAKKK